MEGKLYSPQTFFRDVLAGPDSAHIIGRKRYERHTLVVEYRAEVGEAEVQIVKSMCLTVGRQGSIVNWDNVQKKGCFDIGPQTGLFDEDQGAIVKVDIEIRADMWLPGHHRVIH